MSSSKYAFAKGLKELRFHHCQTSDHSNAIRYTPSTPPYSDVPGTVVAFTDLFSFLTDPSSPEHTQQ